MRAILFVFLDGVGLGPPQETNPLWASDMPALRRLLDGPLVAGIDVDQPELLCKGIDATLGVAGLPQSGSGQTALFTGVNAAALAGHHVFSYPTEPLRQVIAEHSLLKRAVQAGLKATFANAYSEGYWAWAERERKGRHSASTLTNLAAGLPFRSFEQLNRGQAVYWDITHEASFHFVGLAPIPAELAGRRLAELAAQHHLTLYESFLTDLAGHRRLPHPIQWTLARVDGLLHGVLSARPPDLSLVLSSDHGNVEQANFKGHTRNPVPLLVVGPAASAFRPVQSITDVAGAILAWLNGTGD